MFHTICILAASIINAIYLPFVLGIVLADIMHSGRAGFVRNGKALIIAGIAFGLLPETFFPDWFSFDIQCSVAAFTVCLGFATSSWKRSRLLEWIGKVSFGIILINPIMEFSFSAKQLVMMVETGISMPVTLGLVLLVALPLNIMAGALFERAVRPVSTYFSGMALAFCYNGRFSCIQEKHRQS